VKIIKRISKKSAKRFVKAGYSIYNNDKILILKQYPTYKTNFKKILEPLETFIFGVGNILYSVVLLIITLIDFVPRINVIDESIDENERKEQEEIDEEMRNRFNKERND